jgi:hypothetical protein
VCVCVCVCVCERIDIAHTQSQLLFDEAVQKFRAAGAHDALLSYEMRHDVYVCACCVDLCCVHAAGPTTSMRAHSSS